MTLYRRRRSNYDANTVIPNTLLPQLVAAVANAHSSSKVSYLRQEMLSKFTIPDKLTRASRRQLAIEKWLAVELENEETNLRLQHIPWEYRILPGTRFDKFVSFVRAIIEDVIGAVPDYENFSFSGGATTSRNRLRSHPSEKYVGRADITQDALPLLLSICEDGSLSRDESLSWKYSIVPGNVMFTVPKNALIDRVACKEPDLNMYMQKAVGDHFRSSLRRVGIDLNDQSRNRDLAREGSITGALATLDLSSASDCVTTGICELLLPDLWFSQLMCLRSPTTNIDGELHVNAMMSSMGNGFTFELESLLFYSLCRAVAFFEGVSGVISVYGDDIIIPVGIFDSVVSVLGFFGFKPNVKKSFASGPFRESCGGHYHSGIDITPFYVKGPIRTLTDIIHLGNQVRKWSDLGFCVLDPTLEPLWLEIKRIVPKSLWGGTDYGDKGVLVTPDAPRKRLVPVIVPKDVPEIGRYAVSIDARSLDTPEPRFTRDSLVTWARTRVITLAPTSDTGRWRVRRNTRHGAIPAEFLSEIAAYVDKDIHIL